MDKIILLSITIGIILLIYIVIMYFIFMLSFVKLFEKEKYNKTHAYIPLYNFYLYFKLLKLPAFLVFIPIINIIAIAFSPYNLSRRYGYNVNESWLSVLLPFIYVPRIANSDKKNIFYEHDNDFVTSSEDIDKLEKKLESESSDIINDINEYKPITTEEHPVDSIKVLEESIDNTTDEIIYDEIEEKSTPEITKTEDTIEILDSPNEIIDDNITMDQIEKLDERSESNINEKNIDTNIQEVEKEVNINAIAFGGKEEVETISSQSKKNDTKCPRCGASLIGATDRCLGCGLELKNIS